MKQPLLIELCTEELPPKSLSALSASFSASVLEVLQQNALLTTPGEWQAFASPRRLAVLVQAVAAQQPDRKQQRQGPTLQAAYDATGKPTKAALGFARSCGAVLADLSKAEQAALAPGARLTLQQTIKGKNITEIAQLALDTAIKNLPIAKRMRWGNGNAEFVRPVHKLLALHGAEVLALTAFGLNAGRQTLGHRFHCPEPINIDQADQYANTLEKHGKVIADFAKRKQQICHDVRQLAEKLAPNGQATAVIDEALLNEVTGLVEWPVAIIGNFANDFLSVPTEALIASMKDHQKYFHLVDDKHQLLPHFIAVSNIESTQVARVIAGNERVLHARLSDAMFFWQQDKIQPLAAKYEQLEQVLFHVKLGSVADKAKRIAEVARFIGAQTGADLSLIAQAAALCKNDLVSYMVGEFPSLQGTMGRYYALHDGSTAAVADIIEQHYWPRFAGDKLAQSAEAVALAMADRIDTLVGIFASGEKPTGVKDPYALRRAALGIIRMLIDKKMAISLQDLLAQSIATYQANRPASAKSSSAKSTSAKSTSINLSAEQLLGAQQQINQFILDRLRAFYLAYGFSTNQFNAVAACHPARAIDFDNRIRAIKQFYAQNADAAQALAAANKRIANILRAHAHSNGDSTKPAIPAFDRAIAIEAAEQLLAINLENIGNEVQTSLDKKNYTAALTALARLRPDVDRFFDNIMVMDADPSKRGNRLALLQQLRALFLQVADISHLATDK